MHVKSPIRTYSHIRQKFRVSQFSWFCIQSWTFPRKFLLNKLFNRFHATWVIVQPWKLCRMVICIPTAKNFPLESFAIYGTSMTLLFGGTDALLCLYTVPLFSELERLWSSRASQFRNEKNDLTTPWHMQCIGWSSASSVSCTDWVYMWHHLQDNYEVWSLEKPRSSLMPDF